MDPAEADEKYGAKVWQNRHYVVRVKAKEDVPHIVVHKKTDQGVEELPLGYVLGSNALDPSY